MSGKSTRVQIFNAAALGALMMTVGGLIAWGFGGMLFAGGLAIVLVCTVDCLSGGVSE